MARVPLYRTADHRYARPDPFVVVVHPIHRPPPYRWYRPYWTRWWVHPYWRWTYASAAVVWFDYDPDPWFDGWVPPARGQWVWVPGHRVGVFWVPGHWVPGGPVPTAYGARWVFVPGWWIGPAYIEGYWRRDVRDGWAWVDGYYLDDGTFVPGYWEPTGKPPRAGYTWEPGYWDGKYWVEGFWRPEIRTGYRWVSGWLDDDGIYHSGYWEPTDDRPGMMWIPGWFDGDAWVDGYWVTQQEYDQADPDAYQPDPGWDQQRDATEPPPSDEGDDEPPPAIPVEP